MSAQAFWQALTRGMSPQDQQALVETLNYLGQKARSDGPLPEGSLASVINRQTPAVRNAIAHISGAMETPRTRPFEEKLDEHQMAERMSFADPEAAVHIKSALDGQEVTARLIDRMGSDADNPDTSPPTDREILSAAYDLHNQENQHG